MTGPGIAQKSPEAFRTISEVAAELEVPQHVLRFWETKFATVKPLKRGGGRRYYRPDDVDLLRGIQALLYREGMTIRGVQKIIKDRGARYVMDVGRGGTVAVPQAAVAEGEVARSNIHPFRRAAKELAGATFDAADRSRLEALLRELLGLKARLSAARERAFA